MDISDFTLIAGSVGMKKDRTACLMSARALLDGRGLCDDHPSQVLQRIGIRINDGDWWKSDDERTHALLPLALDERLCAFKCDISPEAEIKRSKMYVQFALSVVVPAMLDVAAESLPRNVTATITTITSATGAVYAASDAAIVAADASSSSYATDFARVAAAADSAVDAASACFGSDAKKTEIRDSLISLFNRLLDVRA